MLKKEYKFIIFLLIVLGIFFYPFILLGKIPFPGDLLIGGYNPWRSYSLFGFAPGGYPNKAQYFDVLRQLYPWKALVIESFKQFSVPLWNPYNFSGSPLVANNQSSAFYPFNVLYFIFPQAIAWGLLVLLQPLLASIGTYLFTRKIGVGKWGSLLASIAYGFCLFQTVFLEYNTMGHVVALLPWALLGIELVIHKKKMWGSLVIVLSLVFSFFAGHIQLWGFSLLFIVAYALFRLLSQQKKIRFGMEIGLLILFALAISAIQLVPTFELIGQAARVSQNYSFLVNNLLIQPYQLLVLLIPDLFGNPATRNYLLSDSYPGNAMYIGVLPLLFALFSLTKIRFSRFIAFFSGMTILIFFFLVRTPFTELFYKLHIPLFSTGSPSNALFLASFCLAILSAFGFEYFLQKKNKKALIITGILFLLIGLVISAPKIFQIQINYKNTLFSLLLLGTGGVVVGIGYIFPKKKILISIAILFITVFDLFYFFQKFNPFVKPSLLYPPVRITQTLQRLVGTQRVWSYGDANVESNVWSMYHIEDPNGYDPLYPKTYGEFISSSLDGKIHAEFTNQSRSDAVIAPAYKEEDLAKDSYRFKVLNATSVGYILSKEVLSNDFLSQHKWNIAAAQDGWIIYRNLSALPHAYIVTSYAIYQTPEEFSQKFYSSNFPLESSVLLERPIGSLSSTSGKAQILHYSPEQIVIKTKTNGKGILVLTDTFFPGWKAFVDGKEVPILRANYTFRAVVVPEGMHTVVFSYQPLSFSIGLTLTIIGLVGLAVFLILIRKTKSAYE